MGGGRRVHEILRKVRHWCDHRLSRFVCVNDDDLGYTYYADFIGTVGWVIVDIGWGEDN